MPLTTGQSLSFYKILGPLGAGGMGEVYRARDTRLEREVAIKVLPEELADDEERLRRFEREAKTLASLNHPNVAGIHGVDQEGDVCFLALELVPGEDLAAHLSRGALALDEAIDVCRQIAEGLEAAHEAGVVHRDLKPANVRITPGGVVKILDFGLAKPIRPEASKSGTTSAQADSFLVTSEGMVLGTPTYMSPEQARGKPVDRRTDIWAFGCVLYECLTGKRAFEGEGFGDLIAAILAQEVDLDALPAATPPRVRDLLVRTLTRDPRGRLRDIGDARIVLEEVLSGHTEDQRTPAAPTATAPAARPRWLPWSIAVVAIAGACLAAARPWRTPARASPDRQVRFTIRHPSETRAVVLNPLVSPDGSYVAYIGVEGTVARIWVRELDARRARVLPGTEGASVTFISPDSRFVGFYAGNKMKKVAVSGGTPVEICDNTPNPGATWAADGSILFSRTWTTGLTRFRPEDGTLEELTRLDTEAGETAHWWPTPLPGGRRLLYTVFTSGGTLNKARIMLLDLETGTSRFVTDGARPTFLSTGHLLFHRAGVYEIVPFDAETGSITGSPKTVLEDVPPLAPAGKWLRFLSLSESGVMAYMTRKNDVDTAPRHWFWLDRSGELELLPLPAGTRTNPALSPDGSRLAIVRTVSGEPDIFVHDLEDGSEARITTDTVNNNPMWSADGERLLFDTLMLGTYDIFEADPRGGRAPQPLYTYNGDVFSAGITPDGKTLVARVSKADTEPGIILVDLESGEVEPFLTAPGTDEDLRLSPDGRLLAYTSNVSGTNQVYVVPLSDASVPVKVSRSGGNHPGWTRSGAQLAFNDGTQILVADLSFEDGEVSAGRPSPFVSEGLSEDLQQRFAGDFSIAPDGERILIGLLDEPVRAEIEVVLDGFAALGVE